MSKFKFHYLKKSSRAFDPFSLIISLSLLIFILMVGLRQQQNASIFDIKGLIIVGLGTFASILFQFNFYGIMKACQILATTLASQKNLELKKAVLTLDDLILNNRELESLNLGQKISGEVLNDVIYMTRRGLFASEIEEFLTARIRDEHNERISAAHLFQRAAISCPSFGLFGTVIGLISVLKSLSNPSQIGSAMALALLTTAYGAAFATFFLNPLAGRIDSHSQNVLELYEQILSRIKVILNRRERSMTRLNELKKAEAA